MHPLHLTDEFKNKQVVRPIINLWEELLRCEPDTRLYGDIGWAAAQVFGPIQTEPCLFILIGQIRYFDGAGTLDHLREGDHAAATLNGGRLLVSIYTS
ncbi:MAG: hypothetical protein HY565_03430 [Candidatus Kerfeldbacteria bacterium]|nr:hypothetical protein [Candidatus Kerfeldbacteria bacterium]